MIEWRGAAHAEEDVGLVFAMIETAHEGALAGCGIVADAGVVAAGDVIGADGLGIFRELAEFEPVVAAHAGVRRAPAVVLIDEVVDDPPEVFFKVEDVEGDVEHTGDAPRILRVQHGAAALLIFTAAAFAGLRFGLP